MEYKLKPYKIYSYNSLKASVQRLLSRPGFLQKCEHWRNRSAASDILTDIYDGRVWNDFMMIDREPFLQEPYSHVCDSVGAIYLIIQNLPRSERYKWENMILVGLIPGPKEPNYSINSYLYPLVQELQQFWSGV